MGWRGSSTRQPVPMGGHPDKLVHRAPSPGGVVVVVVVSMTSNHGRRAPPQRQHKRNLPWTEDLIVPSAVSPDRRPFIYNSGNNNSSNNS